MNGRCVGNVYEWCDPWTRGLARIDCTARGQICNARATLYYETDQNGCTGEPCPGPGFGECEGSLISQCREDGNVRTWDCRKTFGPDSRCEIGGADTVRCTYAATCPRPPTSEGTTRCQGTAVFRCNEEGEEVVEDCQRCDLTGECQTSASGRDGCTVFSWGCDASRPPDP
jgi:hypothetical protein